MDNLGRIVLPIELRRVLDIDKDAALEVYVDNDSIVLKKVPACVHLLRQRRRRRAVSGPEHLRRMP